MCASIFKECSTFFCYSMFLHAVPPSSANILFIFEEWKDPPSPARKSTLYTQFLVKSPLILDYVKSYHGAAYGTSQYNT